jgi:predicted RNA-binding Zn-ribbon protein involved in translation (DUF1610 family)
VTNYVAPASHLEAFTCPHCGVIAHQTWTRFTVQYAGAPDGNVTFSRCQHCGAECIWRFDRMIDPSGWIGPTPHEQMPENVLEFYTEASEIGGRSPRAAAALLRLGLQTLIDDLRPGGGDINAKIGALVKDGLDPDVQLAMDVVRVVGNNAVHPGELQIDDDPSLVPAMFELVNMIVEQMIARPGKLRALFEKLPDRARDAIGRRDGSKEEGPVTKP